MEKESVSPCVKPKRGRKGRPPKSSKDAKPQQPTSADSPVPPSLQGSSCASLAHLAEPLMSAEAIKRVKQIQEDEDKKIMPPPPPAADLDQQEELVDGHSIIGFITDADLQASLKRHANVYENKHLSYDNLVKKQKAQTSPKPNTPSRKGKAPAKIGKESIKLSGNTSCVKTEYSADSDPTQNSVDNGASPVFKSKVEVKDEKEPELKVNGILHLSTEQSIEESYSTGSKCKSFHAGSVSCRNASLAAYSTTHHEEGACLKASSSASAGTTSEINNTTVTTSAIEQCHKLSPNIRNSNYEQLSTVSQVGKKHSEKSSSSASLNASSRGSVEDTSRSNSVRSHSTTGSHHTPPVQSTFATRDLDSTSRTSSRNSDRTFSGTGSSLPISSQQTDYSSLYSQYLSPATMLSLGGNGMPFNPAMAAAGLLHAPPGLPGFSPDMLSPYHASALAANEAMQRQAELNRRFLLEGAMVPDRGALPPFMRPDLFLPHLSSASIGSPMVPPALQSMANSQSQHLFGLDKLKMDPLSLYQRNAAAAAAGYGSSPTAASFATPPGSLFQSVHSGSSSGLNSSSASSSTPKMKAKTDKREKAGETSSESKLNSSSGNLSTHPFRVSAALHKPQEITSPSSIFQPLCLDRSSTASSTPSNYSSQSGSLPTMNGTPASLSVPSLTLPLSRENDWQKISGISTTSAKSGSSWQRGGETDRRDRVERETHRNSVESRLGRSATPDRLRHLDLSSRGRSRSRSPHRLPQISTDKDKLSVKTELNGLDSRSDYLQQSMLAAELQRQSMLNGMFPGITDNKPPGLGDLQAMWSPFRGISNPLSELQQQQREIEIQRDRDRSMLMQMNLNPSMALLAAEKNRMQLQKEFEMKRRLLEQERLHEMDRAKVTAVSMGMRPNPNVTMNGFHHPSQLGTINSLAGGPPPLIPTSQAKLSSPVHAKHNGTTNGASSSAGTSSETETHSR